MNLPYQRVPVDFQNLKDAWRRLGNGLNWLLNELNPPGYGGLYLTAPITHGTPIVLTTTFQKITGFDASIVDPPKGLTVDLPNDRFRLTERGMWNFNFTAVGEITPFTGNTAQTIEMAVYNETDGVAHLISYHPVPRYSDVFEVSVSGQRKIPFGVFGLGDWVSLWIRQRTATPALVVTVTQELEMSTFRVD